MPETQVVETSGSTPLRIASHERYARARAELHTAVEAARIAGYADKSGAITKVEKRRDVQARIAYLVGQPEETIRAKRQALEAWLWRVLRFDPGIFWDGGRMKSWKDIDPEDRTLIEDLEYITSLGIFRPKLASKMEAHVELRKMLGGDAPAKVAATDPSGMYPAQVIVEIIRFSDAKNPIAA